MLTGPLLLGEQGAQLLAPAGAIVLTSSAHRPDPRTSMVAAPNSPPPSFAATPAAMTRRLPAGRIGRTRDTADAIIALLRNGLIVAP
jgi:hypothetical protein